MSSSSPPTNTPTGSRGPSLRKWFSSLSRGRQVLAVALVLIFVGSIVCVVGITVVGWRWPFWLWIVFLAVGVCSAVAFLGLFVNSDLPPKWKRGLSAGSPLLLAIVAVVAVPAHDPTKSASDGQSSSNNSSLATTSSQSSVSAFPSPAPFPKEQTVNATSDVEGAPGASASPQTGPLIVSADHIFNSCSGAPGWRVPLEPNQLGKAPYADTVDSGIVQWAKDHGGTEASGTRLEFTLQGTSDSAVIIKGIEIKVVEKVEPSPGTHVVGYGECGGNDESQYLVGKLDDSPPQVYEGTPKVVNQVEVVEKKSSRSLSARTFHVSNSDPLKFVLVTYGSEYDYTWQLLIRWLSPDGTEHATIVNNEDGEPFSTAARLSKVAYMNVPNERGVTWEEATPMWGG
jgi:hypothetical protein